MNSYLIEFRFQSKRVKTYLKRMIYEINRKFKVGKRKNVPHITLAGPLTTNYEKRLISDFARVCSETRLMKFTLRGFGTFDSNRVVYVNIGASERFNEFRIKLSNTIRPYCKLKPHDKREDKEKFGYHSTIAMKISQDKFNKIKNYINSKQKPNFTQVVMRVTLLKNGKILREYDFVQRRLLNRWQSLNKHVSRKSKSLLRQFMQGNYDPDRRMGKITQPKSKSFWDKIRAFFGI